MEVRRVYIDKAKVKNGLLFATGPLYRYIVTVLRKSPGERIDLIDGKGYLYRAQIHAIKKREVYFKILDVVHKPEEKKPKVTLCVSPIKGSRMDWMIEKVTELGVDRIVPTVFKRSVVRIEPGDEKIERWKRLTVEASRQCGRFTIPEVTDPHPLRGILSVVQEAKNRWVLYEKEKERSIKDAFTGYRDGEICLVVGPEGGIEESEVSWLRENGFESISLGSIIFRAETAPIFALSIILYENLKR